MTDKELRKLKRMELLELLTSISEENETLRTEKAQLEKKLEDRVIKLEKAGSIADAALEITDILKAAQDSGAIYLENIERIHGDAQCQAEKILDKARAESEALLMEAEKKSQAMLDESQRRCAALEAETQKSADEKWDEVHKLLDQYVKTHEELKNSLKSL